MAVGGDLAPGRLMEAYYRGIFPWYSEDTPILWHSPDPRGVLMLEDLHVPRRLERDLKTGKFTFTVNAAFSEVIRTCARIHEELHGGTWILPEMVEAYEHVHRLGHAHSMEAWRDGELVGGIYGVAVGAVFCAESKFHLARDASKAVLVALCRRLREACFVLLDAQMPTSHLGTFGIRPMKREKYLSLLATHRDQDLPFPGKQFEVPE